MKKSTAAEKRRVKKRKQTGGKGGRGNQSKKKNTKLPPLYKTQSVAALTRNNDDPEDEDEMEMEEGEVQLVRVVPAHDFEDDGSEEVQVVEGPPAAASLHPSRPSAVDDDVSQEAVRNEVASAQQSRRAASRAALGEEAGNDLPHAPMQPPFASQSRQDLQEPLNDLQGHQGGGDGVDDAPDGVDDAPDGVDDAPDGVDDVVAPNQDQDNDQDDRILCIGCPYLFHRVDPKTVAEARRPGMMCDPCTIECTKQLSQVVKAKKDREALMSSHTSTLANNRENASNHDDVESTTHCIACLYFDPNTAASETARLGMMCDDCLEACNKQLEYTKAVMELLEDLMRSHARFTARMQKTSACACCSSSGPRNDVAVPAFSTGKRLCCPAPTKLSPWGFAIRHGNDCGLWCLEALNKFDERALETPEGLEEVRKIAILRDGDTAARQTKAARQSAFRESRPESRTPATKKKYQASQNKARQARRDPIAEAKKNGDLARAIELTEKTYGHRILLEVRADLLSAGRISDYLSLNPLAILADRPEQIGGMSTDGSSDLARGYYLAGMTASSASVVVADVKDGYGLNNLLAGFDVNNRMRPRKKPVGIFQITFLWANVKDIGLGEGDLKSKTIRIYAQVDLDDTPTIEEIMKAGAEVVAVRKVLRNDIKGEDIECSPGAPCYYEQVKHVHIPLELITNDDVKRVLMEAKAGVHGRGAQAALQLGNITSKFVSITPAWWLKDHLEFGLGSSHSYFPFNTSKWNELMTYVKDEKSFYCRLLLSWAGFDGSILPGYFGVILPFEKDKASREAIQEAGRDSSTVVGLFLGIFWDLFGIEPNIYCQPYMCKDLVYLSVSRKKQLCLIAKVLSPYVTDYLSQNRKANLNDYLELWPLSRGETEFSPEEIEQRRQQAYEEYVERHSEDGSAEIDEILQEFADNDEEEYEEVPTAVA